MERVRALQELPVGPWLRRTLKTSTLAAFCLGCISFPAPTPDPHPVELVNIENEVNESELLDVQIAIFEPGELPGSETRSRGLSEQIREAEAVFVPVHLRNTIQKTGHWGAVRVVPAHTSGAEILVTGKIMDSNGETLKLEVSAYDATGREWFRDTFESNVAATSYETDEREDVFQNVYHEIANALAAHRSALKPEEIHQIREVAEMRFGEELVPNAFAGYLTEGDDGVVMLDRLPAQEDPMLDRVRRVRERNYLLVDTLDGSYDTAYLELEEIYTEWRLAWLTETNMIREVEKRKADKQRQAVLLILIAILAGAAMSQGGYNAGAAAAVGAAGALAVQLAIQAESIKEEAEINKAALEELSISLGADVQSIVIDVEGETVELTGSAKAKYEQWREVLTDLYALEVGPELPRMDSPPENLE
jgi:hypothetical protein